MARPREALEETRVAPTVICDSSSGFPGLSTILLLSKTKAFKNAP